MGVVAHWLVGLLIAQAGQGAESEGLPAAGGEAQPAAVGSSTPIAASPLIDISADERRAVQILGDLATPEYETMAAGIVAAEKHKSSLFDAPLRAILKAKVPAGLRALAATALGRLDWPAEVTDLQERIEALGRAAFLPEPDVRLAAIAALGSYPTPEAQKVLKLKLAGTDDVQERAAVSAALAAMRSPEALKHLAGWMGAQSAEGWLYGVPARWSVALAGRRLLADPVAPGVADTVQEIFTVRDTVLVRPLVAYAARASVRTLRLRALEHMAAEPLPVDEPFLIALLGDATPEFRRAAIKGLGAHATPAAAEALTTYILAETSPELMRAAAAALRRHELATLAPVVTPALRRAQGYALELLAFLIRERQGPETIEGKFVAQVRAPSEAGREALAVEDPEARRRVLLPILSGPDVADDERLAALRALEGSDDPAIVEATVRLLGPATSPEVITAAGQALTRVPDEPVVTRLREVIASAPAPQREALDRLLAARSSPEAVEFLAERLRTEKEPRLMVSLLEATASHEEPELAAAAATRLGAEEDLRVLGNVLYRVMRAPDPALEPRLLELVKQGPAPEVGTSEYVEPVPSSTEIEPGRPLTGEAVTALGWTVRRVALETLVALPEPAASEALRELVQDRRLEAPLRLRAIEALATRGNRDDLPILDRLALDDDRDLRGAAKNAMHLIAPELHAEWDQWGRIPLVVTSSVFGTTLLLLSTQIAEELSETGQAKRKVLLGIGGAALGASTSFLLTLKTDVSLGEAGYYTTLGTWGTLGGYSLARAAGLGTREKTGPLWAAIGGELAGVSLGAFTLRGARFSTGDVVLTNATAASFGTGAVSLAYLLRLGGGTAGPADAFALGGLAAVVPLAILSPRLKLDDDQMFGLCTTLAYATWVGAFAPRAIVDHPEKHDTLAGVGVGQAVGLGAGLVLSQVTTFDGESVAWATLGALSGAGLGGGIGLSDLKLSGRPTYAMLEGGTLLGAGVFAWLGPKLEFSATDVGLILMMSAGGAVTGARVPVEVAQGVKVAGVDESTRRRKKWGGGLAGGSVGLYTGLAASQLVDLSGGELAMSGAGAAVLGTGGAGLALMLPELGGGNQFSNMFTAGAAIGAIGLGAFLAPKLRYEPADIALGLSTAGLGAFLGSWLPAYRTPEDEVQPSSERTGGAMLGGALGLIFAGTVSQFTDVDPARVLRVDFGTAGGTAFGAGLGLLLPPSVTHDQGRRTTVALMQAGAVAGYALATVTERRSEYDWADRYHLALGASLGAWHGSLIPYLWREPTDSVPQKERIGGALVGLGVAGAATRLSLHFKRIDADDVTEVGLFDLYATSLGYGLYGLVGAGRQTRYALFDGVGLLGLAAGELLAAHTSYSGSDALLVGTLTLVGAGAGVGLPWVLSDESNRSERTAGAALSAGALGLLGLGVSQAIDYDVDDLPEVMLTSAIVGSGLWGVGRARLHTSERWRYGLGDVGLYAGLALGMVAAPHTAFSEDDFWWTLSGSALGAWLGGLTPQLVYGDRNASHGRQGGAVAGAAAGALVTGTAMQWLELPKDWVWGAASVSVATTLVSGGLSMLDYPASPKHQALSMQLAAVGGVVAAGVLAPYTQPRVEDLGTTLAGGGLGAWFGAFAPTALRLDANHRAGGGAMSGAGLGMLLGYGAAQVVDFSLYDNLETIAWSGVGSAMGGGLGLMLNLDDARAATSLEVAGLAAWGLSLGLARQTSFEPEDSLLMTVTGLWGAWHGGFLGDAFVKGEDSAARQRGGGVLLGFGTGVAAGALLSQLVDVPSDEWAEATLLMGAGNMIGGGAGYLLRVDDPVWTGLFEVGGLGGLAAGLALAQRTRYSDGDIILTGMSSIFGAAHGAMLRSIIESDDDVSGQASWGGALLGTGLGLAGGMALSQVIEADASDLAEIALVTTAGDVAALGAADWLGLGRRGKLGLVEAGGLGLGALTLLTADQTSFDTGDRVLTAYGALYGAWLGGWAPRIWNGPGEKGDHVGSGILLGSSVGALGAGAVSQLVDYQLADVAEIAFGSTTASAFGAGMGLVLKPDSDLWVPFMEVSGIVGTVAFGYFAPRTEYTTSDAVLGGLSAGYGLYQGAGLSYLAKADDNQVAGAMMAATAAGVLVGSYLGPYIHLSGTDVLMLTAGSAWGVWIGIWSAAAIDAAQKDAAARGVFSLGVGTTAVATDVTLMATSVAISKLVEMPPKQFAWISVGGGLGMVAGLLTSNLSGNKINSKLGIAAGSVGGLLIGTTVTSFFEWEPAEKVAALPPVDATTKRLPAWLPQVDVWFPSVAIGPAGDAEGLSGIEGSQVLLTVSGLLR